MASVANIVRFLPVAGTTVDFVYLSAVTGYRSPTSSPALTDGATYRYRAESSDLSEWEIGEGTWTTATTTLARTTIIHSSTGAKVNFTVAPNVAIVALADQFVNPAGDTMTGALVVPNSSGLKIKDTDASHTLGLVGGSNLTADRTLTLTTGDASRTLTLSADATVSGTNTGDQTASSLGLGTGDSPQFTAVNIGHATDTTITRTAAGDIAVEGNTIYRAGGTDVAVADGGTGLSTIAAGYVPIGNGTSAMVTSSALYVDTATSRVGVGTTSPPGMLTVANSGANDYVLGRFDFSGGDVGATTEDAALLRVTTNSSFRPLLSLVPSSGAGVLVAASGNVLIGSTATFDNVSFARTQIVNNANAALATKVDSTSATTQISFFNPNGRVGYIGTSGSATSYNTTSDRRLKENIAATTLGLAELMKLPVRDFAFISDVTHSTTTGFIAQEVQQVIPWSVTTNGDDGVAPLAASSSPWAVDYGRITPLVVKAVQDIATLGGTFRAALTAWFSDAENGIGDFFAARLHTDELCVKDVCVNRDQLAALLAAQPSAPRSFTSSDPSTPAETPVKKVGLFDGADFLTRLTDAEYGAILAAATQSIQLARWLDTFRLRGEIDVTGKTALAAKAGLVKAGLLTPDRADVIFAAG